MKRYLLADAARTDLIEIWDYLAEKVSPTLADHLVEDLHVAMMKLVESPHIGHRRTDLTNRPVRFWTVHSYFVIYHPDTEPLAIARIVHGSRDIPAILLGE